MERNHQIDVTVDGRTMLQHDQEKQSVKAQYEFIYQIIDKDARRYGRNTDVAVQIQKYVTMCVMGVTFICVIRQSILEISKKPNTSSLAVRSSEIQTLGHKKYYVPSKRQVPITQ
jgi:hypothetical protein